MKPPLIKPATNKVRTDPSPIDPQSLYLPFSAGDIVVVGVSGGADSVALLHLLCHAPMPLQLVVCHLNHQLRGEESRADALFVAQLAEQWGLPFVQQSRPIATLSTDTKQSLELCARTERYRFFTEVATQKAREWNATLPAIEPNEEGDDTTAQDGAVLDDPKVYISTGHTRSDEVETILFRLARGTGLAGLCGIPRQRGQIVRPLLDLSREQIEAYCIHHGLAYREDSSNASLSFTRNRIRHTVLPALSQVHPKAEQNIAYTAQILRQEEDFLSHHAAQQYDLLLSDGGLNAPAFRRLHPAVQYRVLALFFAAHGRSLGGHPMRCALTIAQSHGRMTLHPTTDFVCDGTRIYLIKHPAPLTKINLTPKFLPQEGLFQSFSGKVYEISEFFNDFSVRFDEISSDLFDLFLDCGKIQGRIIMRTRHPGDRIKLPGYHCTKTFKHLFQEHQTPLPLRPLLFVLHDDNGVIALEDFGVSQRVACLSNTRHYLRIRRYHLAATTHTNQHHGGH